MIPSTKKFWEEIARQDIYDRAEMTIDNPEEIEKATEILRILKGKHIETVLIMGSATGTREYSLLEKINLKVREIFLNDFIPLFVERASDPYSRDPKYKQVTPLAESLISTLQRIKIDKNGCLLIGIYGSESFWKKGYDTYKRNFHILGREAGKKIGNLFTTRLSKTPTVQYFTEKGFFSTWFSREDVEEICNLLGLKFVEIPKGYLLFNCPLTVNSLYLMLNNVLGNLLPYEQKQVIQLLGEKKILYGTPEYFEKIQGVIFGKDSLDFLSLNLPFRCNLSCQKCVFKARKRRGITLSIKEYKKVIDEAADLGVKGIAITGEGEPLLFPGFKELIEYANGYNLLIVFATNGTLIDEDWSSFLEKSDVSFTISVDTLNKERYTTACGNSKFLEQALKAIENLRLRFSSKVKREGNYKIFYTGIHSVFSDDNFHEMSEIKKLAGEDFYYSAASSYTHLSEKTHREIKPTFLLTKVELPHISQPKELCAYMTYGLAIGSNGEVFICDHGIESEGMIGNIRDRDLAFYLKKIRGILREWYKNSPPQTFCLRREKKYFQLVEDFLPLRKGKG